MSELSPFRCRADMRVTVANKRTKCNGAHITDIMSRGILNDASLAIMQVFKEYGFLNRYNAERLVNCRYKEAPWIKKNYEAEFKVLTEHAVLLRYNVSGGDECWAPSYSLSHGADVYMEQSFGSRVVRLFTKPASAVIEQPQELMRIQSYNQFHAAMLEYYGDRIIKCYRQYTVSYGDRKACIDGIYRIRRNKTDNEYYDIMIISQRQYEGWKQDYVSRLRGCFECRMTERPTVIVLCENDIYTITAERMRMTSDKVNRMNVMYTVDINSAFLNESPLHGLYKYKGTGSDMLSYDIIDINI